MASSHFSFYLHGHLPWVIGHGHWPHGQEWLSEAAMETYIPILRSLDRLEADGVRGGITMSLSPVLAEQLAHPAFAPAFRDYLEERERTVAKDARKDWPAEPGRRELAAWWHRFYRGHLRFLDRHQDDLLGAFRRASERGAVELATCGATHHYFPLMARDESVALQCELAVRVHQRRFGSAPRGIWLPECGYRPSGLWRNRDGVEVPRAGVEQLVAAAGLRWFIVDSSLITGGRAVGAYPNRTHDLEVARRASAGRVLPATRAKDTRQSYWVADGDEAPRVACYSRDAATGLQVWCGDHGYPGDPRYLDFHKKSDTGGHRYWAISGAHVDLAAKGIYDRAGAEERVRLHADHFADLVAATLEGAKSPSILCAPYDAELFGHWWFEGVDFLEAAVRRLAARPDVELTTLSGYREAHGPTDVLALPEGSWGEGGGHAVWDNPQVAWTWPVFDRAEESVWEVEELTRGRTDGSRRFAVAAMRQFLIGAASDWAFLITTNGAPDYAEERIRKHAESIERLAATARRVAGGDVPDTAGMAEIEKVETTDDVFPELEEAIAAARRAVARVRVGQVA